MKFNENMRFENELNKQRRSLEYLNELESECKGLENLLCKNVINVISKKIDNIERKFSDELKYKENKNTERNKKKIEDRRIETLNNNIDFIQNSLNGSTISPDVSTSDLIARKIEENYLLLDELEKSNRPIFSIKTESKNKVFVENKIKEMDDKLGTLFTAYREKNKAAGLSGTADIGQDQNEFKREVTFIPENGNNIGKPSSNPLDEKQKREKEKMERLKELHEKLTSTEKKIKKIAGTILKNF